MAIVSSVAFLLLLGLIIGGMGVFRYQEVAALAREASRWASVHGAQYHQDTGKTAATASDVYTNAIQPNLAALDPAKLSYSVTWNPDNQPFDSTVTVTVSYQWFPELYLVGPITLTSTSTTKMSY
jgi:Flp pilus assembly protein TadG